jgi:hypothetical protein
MPCLLPTRLLSKKIGKVYSLECTDIPKMFFTPHNVDHCNNIYVIRGYCFSTICSNNDLFPLLRNNVSQQWETKVSIEDDSLLGCCAGRNWRCCDERAEWTVRSARSSHLCTTLSHGNSYMSRFLRDILHALRDFYLFRICTYYYYYYYYYFCGSTVLIRTRAFSHMRFLELFRHTVGLLGRVISPSQGLYLHRTTQHRKTRDKHP